MGNEIIGILPMGGQGTRLGLPFPKPLAPTITISGQIKPLYWHALQQLREVTDHIEAIISSRTCECLISSLTADGVGRIIVTEPTLPGSLAATAMLLGDDFSNDTLLAVALPDSIWRLRPGKTLRDVVGKVRSDGALALFAAKADELDDVILDGERVSEVRTKNNDYGMVKGWGAFVVRAGALARFNGYEKDGPQLGRLDMGWDLIGNYVDLGTPERYVQWHDTRSWNEI